jgi:predicted TIM-barrel fold metal-dependent hydrolase
MDHFGIHEALVLDSISVGNAPHLGNERILAQNAGQPRLHPAWAAVLPHSRELPPPADLVAQMRAHAVGALWVFYGQYNLPLEDWAMGDLLSALEEASVPLFLCPTDQIEPWRIDATDWRGVVGLCRKFPDLPVVVTEERVYRSHRALYEALAACPNLMVDLSILWLHRRIEHICAEFGPSRLVWGSKLPANTPGSPKMQLDWSDIAQDDLALIAGGNMRRLLSWNPTITFAADVTFPEPLDPLHKAARDRLSLASESFYDCHGHIGWGDPYHVMNDTPEGVVAEMDRCGVRASIVFGMQLLADVRYGIDEVADMVHQFPDRFVGLTMVNPRNGEAQMLEDLDYGAGLGMRGIKLMTNSYGAYDVNGPLIDVCCKWVNDRRQIILSHYWGAPERLLQLCRDNPDATLIVGHTYGEFVHVFHEVGNVYLCTCPLLGWRQTEQYVEMYGADRIMFGSDLMDLPIAWGLGQIMYARIPESAKRKILGENLLALLTSHGLKP